MKQTINFPTHRCLNALESKLCNLIQNYKPLKFSILLSTEKPAFKAISNDITLLFDLTDGTVSGCVPTLMKTKVNDFLDYLTALVIKDEYSEN